MCKSKKPDEKESGGVDGQEGTDQIFTGSKIITERGVFRPDEVRKLLIEGEGI